MPFGELLKAARRLKGWNQQKLAESLGVHRNTISAWERGEWMPATRGIVVEIARCLGQEERDFLEAALLVA